MRTLASRALASAALLLVPLSALAQTPAPQFIEVLTITVNSGGAPDYEAFVKRIIAGADKISAAGPVTVHGFQLVRGGPGDTYMFVFPFNRSEELDAFMPVPQILSRAYGEAEGARILKSGSATVAHFDSTVYRLLEDLSTKPRGFDSSAGNYVLLVRTEVEPAMAAEYERYLGRLRAAQEQATDPFATIRRVSTMGRSHVYLAASFFNKFADLDRRPTPQELLRKVYGETEGRRLQEDSLRAVRKREIMVLAFRPDLSRLPAASKR